MPSLPNRTVCSNCNQLIAVQVRATLSVPTFVVNLFLVTNLRKTLSSFPYAEVDDNYLLRFQSNMEPRILKETPTLIICVPVFIFFPLWYNSLS